MKIKSVEYLHELASLRGGKCLSTEYINNKAKYEWECGKCGNRWWATAGNTQQGYWCPECGGTKHKDINWLHTLASSKGGKCLSTEYINIQTKYEWECDRGHRWQATAQNICNNGSWCPHCVVTHSRSELQIYEFVKQLFPDALNGQRKLLVSPRFELDIYVLSLRKAIEFDGIFWHSRPKAQKQDARKNQECEVRGIKLLRIPEQLFLDNPQQVFDMVKTFLFTSDSSSSTP